VSVRCLVGVYSFSAWFPGGRWWRTEGTATDHAGEDWRPRFPKRQPLHGWYDDTQDTMDIQIRQAEGHGIEFFVLLWYPPAETQTEDGSWDEEAYTGTGFPGDFYINYELYRHVFPLLALGRWTARYGAEAAEAVSGG